MSFPITVLLGAIAGFTIFLGLPFARVNKIPRSWQAFLNAMATGILFFLVFDILSKATEPITRALGDAQTGKPGQFILLLALFVLGFGAGLLGLVYFEGRFVKATANDARQHKASPYRLALMIATGIGLHNLSEGLAIGQAAGAHAISLATILIIGFGAHNATEGFGIGGPMIAFGTKPTWKQIGYLGLIGGGPTFLGTILGYGFQSEAVFVLSLALASGTIFYVMSELLHVGRGFGFREVVMWGIFVGFFLGFGTDLLLTWAGA